MGTNVRQNIVTNGLVLYLDAGNRQSYVSGSTTWNDLSGNGYSGSLTNGPTFNPANQGGIVQNGTNNYITLPAVSSLSFVGNTSFSCELITQAKTYPSQDYPGILAFGEYDGSGAGGWSSGMYYNIADGVPFGVFSFGRSRGNTLDAGGGVSYIFTSTADSTTINNWTYTYSSTLGGVLYRNGVISMITATTGSVVSTNLTNYYIGRRGNNSTRVTNNNIYSLKVYNRALSAQEVAQNYNATKTRFGLI